LKKPALNALRCLQGAPAATRTLDAKTRPYAIPWSFCRALPLIPHIWFRVLLVDARSFTLREEGGLFRMPSKQSKRIRFPSVQKHLWAALRKPIENDGVRGVIFWEAVSRLVSRLLIDTPVSPNAVTVASFFTALCGALLLPRFLTAGAVLYWFSSCSTAWTRTRRLRFEGSRLGQWLDTIADDGATVAFSLGCHMPCSRTSGRGAAGYAVAAAYAVSAFPSIFSCRACRRRQAQYPYFFMGERGAASTEKKLLGVDCVCFQA
jgi:phosphatidylglycerophosphate synthase